MHCFSSLARTFLGLWFGLQTCTGQAAGQLDTTFGNHGYARLTGTSAPGPQATVLLPDGTLVFASSRPTTTRDLVLGALTSDGNPDARFASGGLLSVATGGTIYRPLLRYDVRTQKTLLAASDYRNGTYNLLICRILANGSLDPSFSIASHPNQLGCVSIAPPAFAPSGVLIAGLMPLANGTILVGGSAYDFNGNNFRAFEGQIVPAEVSTINPVTLNAVPLLSNVYINAVTFNPVQNEIFFTGFQRLGANDSALVVARLNNTGISSYLHNPNLVANAVEDGRAIVYRGLDQVYVVGNVETQGGKSDCVAIRLDHDMIPVAGFGPLGNGRRTVRFNGSNLDSATCDALVTDATGNVYVGGRIGQNGDQFYELAVTKLDTGGNYAGDFGSAGTVRLNPGLTPARSERVLAMQWHHGRLLLAGPSELAVGSSAPTTDQLMTRLTGDDVIFSNGYN